MFLLPLLVCLAALGHSSIAATGKCSTKRSACLNGGTCVDVKPNSHTCSCRQGFTGQNCKTTLQSTPKPAKKCPRLTIKNGAIRLMKKGTIAMFGCNQGYRLSGRPFLKVCRNGVWYNKRTLTCRRRRVIKKKCTFSRKLDRGTVRVRKNTQSSTILMYGCLSGYSLIGRAIRKCSNGKWDSLLEPYCVRAKKCKKPKKPLNGTMFGGRFISGSLVRFFCNDGYEIKGSNQSKCLLNGRWDKPVPKCEKIDPLRDLKNAANNLRRHFINRLELVTTDSRARSGLSSGAAGLDLVFVFDSSASVGKDNFKKGIEFAQTIITEFGVSNSTSGTRVAVVVFSTTAQVIYNLQTKKIVDQQGAINTLKNLKLQGGGTATRLALHTVINEVVPERRNNSKKALFLITDGKSNTGRNPSSPAKLLRDGYSFEIYAIGVTSEVNEKELRDIASEPFRTHVYLLKDFKSLQTLKELITKPKGSNYSECGIAGDTKLRERNDKAVVGKQESNSGAWPWLAVIYVRDKYRCTGVLLADEWVLTAAHCFDNDGKVKGQDVLVVLGEHDRTFIEGTEQNIRVEKIRKHKRYPKTKPEFDLALLKLQNKAKLTSYVRTICLPMRNDRIVIRANGVGIIAGWGSAQTANGRPAFKSLMQTKAKFISQHMCQKQAPHAFSSRMVCAIDSHLNKKDCTGDIGSPIMVHRPHRSDWILAGFAIKGDGCLYKGKTGVFSSLLIREYIRWIERRVKSQNSNG